jgi:cell division protein FtsB
LVLNARELLEDLGMHARALKGAALSARRMEDLEARMFDLESDLEALAVRAKSDKYVCSKCDATFNTTRELTVRPFAPFLTMAGG